MVITGGTSGIGLASARRFAAEGARIAVVGRGGTGAVVEGLPRVHPAPHLGIEADLSEIAGVELVCERLRESFGHLDVVFANAGIALYRPLMEWTEEDFDRVFAINAKAQFFTAQRCVPLLADGGVILFTGSVAADLGQPTMAVYGASKAVAPAYARLFSAELLARRIRAFCLTPGPTDTPIFRKGGLDEAAAREKLERVAEAVPIGRYGDADELAAVALFLASDESSYMLGTEVAVDGGKSQL